MLRYLPLLLTLSALVLIGCGPTKDKDGDNDAAAQAAPAASSAESSTIQIRAATPTEAVAEFFEALRSGDEQRLRLLLTTKARAELDKHQELAIKTSASPAAEFSVGEVSMIDDPPGAHVMGVWVEKNPAGFEEQLEVAWILRKEPAGWRIMGLMARAAEQDLLINFENPEEAQRQREEAEARARAAVEAARTATVPQEYATPPAEDPGTIR